MATLVHSGFSSAPDKGDLKRISSEYSFLQNVRGFGRRGLKRQGVQTKFVADASIMGLFDLNIDGYPPSADKIIAILSSGDIVVFNPSEIF